METELKRIADSLEELVSLVKGGINVPNLKPAAMAPVPTEVKTTSSAQTVDLPPGIMDAAPTPVPAAPVATPQVLPSTAQDLMGMAQVIAQKLGPKALEFAAWVRQDLLAPYGAKHVLDVSPDKIGEVAQKMIKYAAGRGINA
jgi:hypothetical protein